MNSRHGLLKKLIKHAPFYLMMLPGFTYLIINNYLPLPGLQLAFKRLNYSVGIWKSDWVGLKNIRFLFKSIDSRIIIRNTILYNIVFIVLGTSFAVFVAILLSEVSSGWQKRYQYLNAIMLHVGDSDEMTKKMLEEMDANGLQDIIEEKQRQLNEWAGK